MGERRFLAEPEDVREAQAVLRGAEHHHLARVLRLRPGDAVAVFDGRGSGWRGRVERIDPTSALVRLDEPEDPAVEPGLRVTLLQGIPHGESMDWIVEKATELGASRIVPVICERSVVRPRDGRWNRLDRWRRIALAAAKQSGRLVVPEVAEPCAFDEAIARAPVEGGRIVFHPSGGEVRAPASGAPAGSATLLVGPEGGWSDAELESALGAGWTAAGMGPRILRADTAAAVAIALVLAAAGELAPGAGAARVL